MGALADLLRQQPAAPQAVFMPSNAAEDPALPAPAPRKLSEILRGAPGPQSVLPQAEPEPAALPVPSPQAALPAPPPEPAPHLDAYARHRPQPSPQGVLSGALDPTAPAPATAVLPEQGQGFLGVLQERDPFGQALADIPRIQQEEARAGREQVAQAPSMGERSPGAPGRHTLPMEPHIGGVRGAGGQACRACHWERARRPVCADRG